MFERRAERSAVHHHRVARKEVGMPKRKVVRFANSGTLGEAQQKQFVDEVAGWVDGTDVKGRFVECGSNGMIEWEGDAGKVEELVQMVLDDDRVSDAPEDQQTLQDTEIDSVAFDGWYGHVDPNDPYHLVS